MDTIQNIINFVLIFSFIIVTPITIMLSLLAALIGLNWGINAFLFWVLGDGTTSGFSRSLYKFSPSASAWYDHMTYRPFKGSPRGWQIRAGKRFGIKRWQV